MLKLEQEKKSTFGRCTSILHLIFTVSFTILLVFCTALCPSMPQISFIFRYKSDNVLLLMYVGGLEQAM